MEAMTDEVTTCPTARLVLVPCGQALAAPVKERTMNSLMKVENGAGERHDIAGAEWTWKVRSAQTNGNFCFFEMTLESGQGVPLHVHSYPEAFCILEGELEFHSGDEKGEALRCAAGDVVLARPEIPHAFFNRSQSKARLLSLSTAAHEAFFDAVVATDRERPFTSMPRDEIFARVAAIGARTDTRFVVGS
jgi:quercetin dioxygenase-like cupin family protein